VTDATNEQAQPAVPPQASAPVHADNYIVGMAAALLAYLSMAAMNVLAKLLSEHHHVIEIGFYRNLIGFLPFLFMVFAMGKRDILKIRGNRRDIFLRSILGSVSLIFTFAAYAAMPMADTSAFLFTSSLLIPALGFFVLGERVGPFRWSAIALGFLGVLIMLRPTGVVNSVGVSLALGAAMIQAVLQILLRKLGRTERPETVTFYFLGIGAVLTAIPLPLVFTAPGWNELPLIIGIGLCGVFMQMALSIAFKNAPANIITVFNYSSIIWTTTFGWFIWNDWPTLPIWIGGSIVVISNFIIVWREARVGVPGREKPLSSP